MERAKRLELLRILLQAIDLQLRYIKEESDDALIDALGAETEREDA